jgi:hypothetical protein
VRVTGSYPRVMVIGPARPAGATPRGMLPGVTRYRSRSARGRPGPAAGLLGVVLLAGAGAGTWAAVRSPAEPARPAAAPAGATVAPSPSATPSAVATPTSAPTPSETPSVTPAPRLPKGLTAKDVRAGLLSASFPQRGTGRLKVVACDEKARGKGRVVRVRVEVEGGLKVDGDAFAAFALATLNDERSWARDGYRFVRTDGRADVRLVLASPETSAAMCRPLRTFGRLSCHAGDATVLTVYRWVKAIPEYGKDRTGYRQYLVNHEVGHALGHGHVSCPGAGRRAPTMMQQTKGLNGCRPNSWPYP